MRGKSKMKLLFEYVFGFAYQNMIMHNDYQFSFHSKKLLKDGEILYFRIYNKIKRH